MGNEQSDHGILKECTIDDDPIINNKQWSLHHAQLLKHPNPMSVFIGKEDSSSLEKFAKNLRLYRHPDILKFINFTQHQKLFYLFTEKISPLTVVQNQQNLHQISLGLQKILKSLIFLHKVGNLAHTNLCLSSIFVTPEGNWKLGGLEDVEKLSKTTTEDDLNGFVGLVKELIPVDGGTTGSDFVEFVNTQLPTIREAKSPFEEFLSHPFLSSNDFVAIENILTNLPVKTIEERATFFQTLADRLEKLPGIIVSQLSPLLLSRMVLLDQAAVQDFLPRFLTPNSGLLPETLYKEKLIPLLINIFHVRDMQIRLVLLKFFPNYIGMFTETQLEETILPLILLGINDINDEVVAETLKALAILVQALGAAKVIGSKNRKKIFSDGSPSKCVSKDVTESPASSRMHLMSSMSNRRQSSNERQSPIGAETSDEESSSQHKHSTPKLNFDQENDDWGSWEDDEDTNNQSEVLNATTKIPEPDHDDGNCEEEITKKLNSISTTTEKETEAEEVNFFADMEPVIKPTTNLLAMSATAKAEDTQPTVEEEDVLLHDKFAIHAIDVDENEVGWSDIDADGAWSS